jgi:cellulose synthase/poly-beta-1,6-N-acetylglucosamine synthase-like glycosyltransferase
MDFASFLLFSVGAFNGLVLLYFVALNGGYLVTSFLAFGALRRHGVRMESFEVDDLLTTSGAPPITLMAPAFNEEATCAESIRSLLTLRYPEYHVLVVNDGSGDRTMNRLREAFELEEAPLAQTAELPTAPVRGAWRSRRHPNLWVVDKENGGKADALNAGLNFCRTPLFCAIDADTLLEPDALSRIARVFVENAETVAAGGIIRIVNGCTVRSGMVVDVGLPGALLARFQVLEYLRVFLGGRMGWDALDATLIISGAFGMFQRAAVVEVGGYATDTVGEDMELVVRLHRHFREGGIPYRIAYVPDPVAWTECPESLRVLGRQRDRWQRGLVETTLRHRKMLLNPRYGRIGMLVFPYFFFLEMLGPAVEILGYFSFALTVAMGWASPAYVAAFLSVAVLLGIVLSVVAVVLEELSFRRYPRTRDLLRLFGLAVLENFGYRQVNTFWRIRGMVSKLRGAREWGSMERKGFGTKHAT